MSIQRLFQDIRNYFIRRWQPRQRPAYAGMPSVKRVLLHYRWEAESRAFAQALHKELEAPGREVLHLAYWPEKRKHQAPPVEPEAQHCYARGEWNWLGVPRELQAWRDKAPEVLIDFGRDMPPAAEFYRHTLPVALRVSTEAGSWADVHLPGHWPQYPVHEAQRMAHYLNFINNPENETATRNRRGLSNAL